MVTEPHFQLTTGDHTTLQAVLERHSGPYDAFMSLLERKVRESTIYFRDDIPSNVVTIGTRLIYVVDQTTRGPREIVAGEAEEGAGVLSIHTLHGLALLGLSVGSALRVPAENGGVELVQVREILLQPEAQARAAGSVRKVVAFRPRSMGTPVAFDPDDDPGPSAA